MRKHSCRYEWERSWRSGSEGKNAKNAYNRFWPGKNALVLVLPMLRAGRGNEVPIDPVWFEKHVEELKAVLQSEEDMPPLIAHYAEGGFELNDGNHRLEAYRRLGIDAWYMII